MTAPAGDQDAELEQKLADPRLTDADRSQVRRFAYFLSQAGPPGARISPALKRMLKRPEWRQWILGERPK